MGLRCCDLWYTLQHSWSCFLGFASRNLSTNLLGFVFFFLSSAIFFFCKIIPVTSWSSVTGLNVHLQAQLKLPWALFNLFLWITTFSQLLVIAFSLSSVTTALLQIVGFFNFCVLYCIFKCSELPDPTSHSHDCPKTLLFTPRIFLRVYFCDYCPHGWIFFLFHLNLVNNLRKITGCLCHFEGLVSHFFLLLPTAKGHHCFL